MRYWIGVASKDHVSRGVAGGFCQLCHGKAQPLKRMAVGDWIIYYSPKEVFEAATPCQKFTAIGVVVGAEVYPFEMFPGFVPHRRDINFHKANDVPIRPLLGQLSFILKTAVQTTEHESRACQHGKGVLLSTPHSPKKRATPARL